MVATRKKFGIEASKDEVSDLVFTYGLFFGAIIGGRLGSVLFYDLHLQFQDPFYFLKIWEGGMSFHGGLIGVICASIVFAKTGSGNSATVFSTDAAQSWSVSISLVNRDYDNFAGTNGRAMATYNRELGVDDFIPDPADPSGEGVIPVKYTVYQYGVSGVDDPNPAEASTRNIKLTHPVSIASVKAIEATTQEDANAVFTEEIQRRSPVMTLTQAEYDAIPADEIEDDTLYLITS